MFFRHDFASRMPDASEALPGRPDPIPTAERHFVNGQPLKGPYPEGSEIADFALGCFWGEEKLFWETPGVIVTAVGYQGGITPNPTYKEVCTGRTGHAESVRVVFDPKRVSYEELLRIFWEHHDPTQGYRQGNDVGTQYRSAVFTHSDEQQRLAEMSRDMYQAELSRAGYGQITTEIRPAPEFYFAEDYHQQYLAKNPNGYCPDHSTGVACPLNFARQAQIAEAQQPG
ncbi:MAG TPA: peptide-methionine (S)-S-oxide reductase MsrA [candidate division Zixibacteria bacterium]|nr:peptide-methionine (S)-S-oxide reductase MsrA [candidate division Zixibacteria bacterium]